MRLASFLQIDALVEVVEAVQGRVEVYADGGIWKGSDVLKALALGAKCVFIGRPALWGLAYKVGKELWVHLPDSHTLQQSCNWNHGVFTGGEYIFKFHFAEFEVESPQIEWNPDIASDLKTPLNFTISWDFEQWDFEGDGIVLWHLISCCRSLVLKYFRTQDHQYFWKLDLGLFARKMSLTISFAFSKYLGTIHGFGRTISQQCCEFFGNTYRIPSHGWLKHFGQGWAKLCPGVAWAFHCYFSSALLFLNSRHISMIQSASDAGGKHNIIKIKIFLYQLGVFANFFLSTLWMEFFKTFL